MFDRRSVLSACVVAGVATAAFVGFVVRGVSQGPIAVYLFGDPYLAQTYRYDIGFGFAEPNSLSLKRHAGSISSPLPAAFVNGDIVVTFVADGPLMPIIRIDRPAHVRGGRVRVRAGDTAALFEVRDFARLRRVIVEGSGERLELPIAIPTHDPNVPLGVLLDRAGPYPRLSTAWAAPISAHQPRLRAVRIEGTGPPPGYAVAVAVSSSPGLVRVPLTASEEGLASVGRIDWSPLRARGVPLWLTVQAATAVALGLIVLGMARAVRRRRSWLAPAGVFTVFAGGYGLWVAALWPGIVVGDSFGPPLQIELSRNVDLWFSSIYTLLIMALGLVVPGPNTFAYPGLIVLHATATAALVASGLVWLRRRGAPFVLLIPAGLVLLLSPAIGSNIAFYQRDVLNGIVNATILLLVFSTARDQAEPRGGRLAALFGLLLFACLLRPDNLTLAAGTLGVLVVFRAVPLGRLATGAAVWAGIYAVYTGPVERRLVADYPERSRQYALTGLLYPLGAMVVNDYHTMTPEADAAVIERVIPLSKVRQMWSPQRGDLLYWGHCVHTLNTAEEVADLKRVVTRAVRENPLIYLKARAQYALALLGRGVDNQPFNERTRNPLAREPKRNIEPQFLGIDLYTPRTDLLHQTVAGILKQSLAATGWLGWIWSPAPALLLALLAIGMVRWCPLTAAVAAVLLARTGVILLAAPAPFFHYVYDLYLFGPLLPALLAVEWRTRAAVRIARPEPAVEPPPSLRRAA